MKYILNSAVITAPGQYSYRLIDLPEMCLWLDRGGWESTIGYQETADALSAVSGCNIPMNRRMVKMEPGDEALIFRLIFPPGHQRIAPGNKGALTPNFILKHAEYGLLRMEKGGK